MFKNKLFNISNFQSFWLKFRFLTVNFGLSMNLIAKTASPGPGVSVPTQGS